MGRLGNGKHMKEFISGQSFNNNLPKPVIISAPRALWTERMEYRVSKALKAMAIDSSTYIERVLVTRLSAHRGQRWHIGQGRYTLDQCAAEIVRLVVERNENEEAHQDTHANRA